MFTFGTVLEGDLLQLPGVYVTPLGLSMVLAGISGYAVSRRKAKLYRIANEYNLFLLVHDAIESLEVFFKTNSQSDRRRAVEKARRVVERVEEWEVTGLQLIKHEVGRHVIPFKAKLREKLLPALGEGDDENLRRGYDFLAIFAKHLIGTNPAIEDIQVLDSLLAAITTISSDNPLGLQERMTIGRMGHGIAFGICGFAGFFAFRVGYYLLHVPLETAYIAGFGFAGALIAGYLNYVRKQA